MLSEAKHLIAVDADPGIGAMRSFAALQRGGYPARDDRDRGTNMNAPTSAQSRRAVTAAVIGNVLEWYDFAVYAYVAAIIAKKFFPTQDEGNRLRRAGMTN